MAGLVPRTPHRAAENCYWYALTDSLDTTMQPHLHSHPHLLWFLYHLQKKGTGIKGKSGESEGFTASKYFVPKIPDFDSELRFRESKMPSGQSSGNYDSVAPPLGFSSYGRFGKY